MSSGLVFARRAYSVGTCPKSMCVCPSARPSASVRTHLLWSLSEQPKWSHLRNLSKKGDQRWSRDVKSVSHSTWDRKESDYRSEWRMSRHRSQVQMLLNIAYNGLRATLPSRSNLVVFPFKFHFVESRKFMITRSFAINLNGLRTFQSKTWCYRLRNFVSSQKRFPRTFASFSTIPIRLHSIQSLKARCSFSRCSSRLFLVDWSIPRLTLHSWMDPNRLRLFVA